MDPSPSHLLRNHISLQAEDPTVSLESEICITAEISSANGAGFWLQLHQGTINFQHQEDPEKDETLGAILDEFPVPDQVHLEPGSYITFEITSFSTVQLDQFVDKIIQQYFKAISPDQITLRSEEL